MRGGDRLCSEISWEEKHFPLKSSAWKCKQKTRVERSPNRQRIFTDLHLISKNFPRFVTDTNLDATLNTSRRINWWWQTRATDNVNRTGICSIHFVYTTFLLWNSRANWRIKTFDKSTKQNTKYSWEYGKEPFFAVTIYKSILRKVWATENRNFPEFSIEVRKAGAEFYLHFINAKIQVFTLNFFGTFDFFLLCLLIVQR